MGGRIYGLCRDIEPSGESRPDREGRYWDRGETFTERAKTVHGSVSVENGFSTGTIAIRDGERDETVFGAGQDR